VKLAGASPLRYSLPFENTMRQGIDDPSIIVSSSLRTAPEGARAPTSARPV